MYKSYTAFYLIHPIFLCWNLIFNSGISRYKLALLRNYAFVLYISILLNLFAQQPIISYNSTLCNRFWVQEVHPSGQKGTHRMAPLAPIPRQHQSSCIWWRRLPRSIGIIHCSAFVDALPTPHLAFLHGLAVYFPLPFLLAAHPFSIFPQTFASGRG